MAIQPLNPSIKVFQDIDGQPLENGIIYIGDTGLDPETNQKNTP